MKKALIETGVAILAVAILAALIYTLAGYLAMVTVLLV